MRPRIALIDVDSAFCGEAGEADRREAGEADRRADDEAEESRRVKRSRGREETAQAGDESMAVD